MQGNEHSLIRNIGAGKRAILRGNALEIRNEELGQLGASFDVKPGKVREEMTKILAKPDSTEPRSREVFQRFDFDKQAFLDWLDKPDEYLQSLKSLAPINEHHGGELGSGLFDTIRNGVHVQMKIFFQEMSRLRNMILKEGQLESGYREYYEKLLKLEPKILRLFNILYRWHSTYPDPGCGLPLTFKQIGSHLSVMSESLGLGDGRPMYCQNKHDDTGIPIALRDELTKKTGMDHSRSFARALTI